MFGLLAAAAFGMITAISGPLKTICAIANIIL